MPHLLEPFSVRSITFSNRIFVSPMCEYSSEDGFANDWHLVHLGSRAVGGAGLVFAEATAVTPEGRISPQDLGIWKDAHVDMLSRIVRFIHAQGSVSGMQLAHAGRKASTRRPWEGGGRLTELEGGWRNVVAPSPISFADNYPQPIEMTPAMIARAVAAFAAAAKRALKAGFRVIEIHAAHGYLIHEFLSPLSNQRRDGYGGSLENRTRFAREITTAVRKEWPQELPLFMRISATDWAEGGWDLDQSVALAKMLKPLGVDFVDCSSGGNIAAAQIPLAPGYQVPFAERIRKDADIPTGAVGLITTPQQAEEIVSSGRADAVVLAREMLRDPYFPLRAGRELDQEVTWPAQYLRAAPPGAKSRQPLTTIK
ncbi:MAG TPA: NADH:flavin oxidoreductase/NADH oxidase [Vicinamibacterales bacterium]|nr:NADH:flavin oxidoreductase/NADH oxidase [Vicinamibacterales bacterium]